MDGDGSGPPTARVHSRRDNNNRASHPTFRAPRQRPTPGLWLELARPTTMSLSENARPHPQPPSPAHSVCLSGCCYQPRMSLANRLAPHHHDGPTCAVAPPPATMAAEGPSIEKPFVELSAAEAADKVSPRLPSSPPFPSRRPLPSLPPMLFFLSLVPSSPPCCPSFPSRPPPPCCPFFPSVGRPLTRELVPPHPGRRQLTLEMGPCPIVDVIRASSKRRESAGRSSCSRGDLGRRPPLLVCTHEPKQSHTHPYPTAPPFVALTITNTHHNRRRLLMAGGKGYQEITGATLLMAAQDAHLFTTLMRQVRGDDAMDRWVEPRSRCIQTRGSLAASQPARFAR